MADLKTLCIAGKCSDIPTYTAGDNISIADNVISTTNVYNKQEVDELLSTIASLRMEVVTVLPTEGESNVIYLLDDGTGNYDQWVYTETDGWVNLGSEDIDLTDYVKTSDLVTTTKNGLMLATDKAKLDKIDNNYIKNNVVDSETVKINANSWQQIRVNKPTMDGYREVALYVAFPTGTNSSFCFVSVLGHDNSADQYFANVRNVGSSQADIHVRFWSLWVRNL